MKGRLYRLAAKLFSVGSSYITPYIFLSIGESSVYGEVLGSIAICQISFGWLMASLQKVYLYEGKKKYSLSTLSLSGLYLFLAFILVLWFGGWGDSLRYTAATAVSLSMLTKSWLLKVGRISSQVLVSSSLYQLASLIGLVMLAFGMKELDPRVVLLIAILICLLLVRPALFERGDFGNTDEPRPSFRDQLKRSLEMTRDAWKVVFVDVETTFISQLPTVVVQESIGSGAVTELAAISSIIKLPCFYQGYSNPYYGYRLREYVAAKLDRGETRKLFDQQTKANFRFGGCVTILMIALIQLFISSKDWALVTPIAVVVELLIRYRMAIMIGLLAYCLVSWCGPVTTTLLAYRRGRDLSVISLASSSVGSIALLASGYSQELSWIVVATLLPAIISNIVSKRLLDGRVLSGQSIFTVKQE